MLIWPLLAVVAHFQNIGATYAPSLVICPTLRVPPVGRAPEEAPNANDSSKEEEIKRDLIVVDASHDLLRILKQRPASSHRRSRQGRRAGMNVEPFWADWFPQTEPIILPSPVIIIVPDIPSSGDLVPYNQRMRSPSDPVLTLSGSDPRERICGTPALPCLTAGSPDSKSGTKASANDSKLPLLFGVIRNVECYITDGFGHHVYLPVARSTHSIRYPHLDVAVLWRQGCVDVHRYLPNMLDEGGELDMICTVTMGDGVHGVVVQMVATPQRRLYNTSHIVHPKSSDLMERPSQAQADGNSADRMSTDLPYLFSSEDRADWTQLGQGSFATLTFPLPVFVRWMETLGLHALFDSTGFDVRLAGSEDVGGVDEMVQFQVLPRKYFTSELSLDLTFLFLSLLGSVTTYRLLEQVIHRIK